MMIALPNPDRSFTCTLFWPAGSFDALTDPSGIEAHFRENYPDLLPLAPDLVDDYLHNPVGVLGTVHTLPWQAHGRTALLGDAAHAIVPRRSPTWPSTTSSRCATRCRLRSSG